jgi:RecA-family ATPase
MREEAIAATKAEAGDEVQRGRVRAHEGALRAALSHWKRARRVQPQLIEAYWRPIEAHERIKSALNGAGKAGLLLAKILLLQVPWHCYCEMHFYQTLSKP